MGWGVGGYADGNDVCGGSRADEVFRGLVGSYNVRWDQPGALEKTLTASLLWGGYP